MSILVIGGADDHYSFLNALLEREGFKNMFRAKSAEEAFSLLEADNPRHSASEIELIFMESNLPGISGIEACHRFNASPHLKQIPILMITGNRNPDALKASFQAGAADCIGRPLNEIELLARARTAIKRKQELNFLRTREKELFTLTKQMSEANTSLSRHASVDVLTGISNRGRFDEYLEHEWKRAIREDATISLLLLDIDFLDQYNLKFGHEKGDECLQLISELLQNGLRRPADLLARYSGGEFAAILPQTDSQGAKTIAGLLRTGVWNLKIQYPCSDASGFVTLSVGAGTAKPKKEDSQFRLLLAAERAVWQAKKEGGNRVKHSEVS